MTRITALILIAMTAIPASAAEPFCYRSGRLCDCKTHICEGQDGYDKLPPDICGGEWVDDRTYTSHPECRKPTPLTSDIAKPCLPGLPGFGCRTESK